MNPDLKTLYKAYESTRNPEMVKETIRRANPAAGAVLSGDYKATVLEELKRRGIDPNQFLSELQRELTAK